MTIAARKASTLLNYCVYCNGFRSSSMEDLIGVPGGGQKRTILLDLWQRFGDGGNSMDSDILSTWLLAILKQLEEITRWDYVEKVQRYEEGASLSCDFAGVGIGNSIIGEMVMETETWKDWSGLAFWEYKDWRRLDGMHTILTRPNAPILFYVYCPIYDGVTISIMCTSNRTHPRGFYGYLFPSWNVRLGYDFWTSRERCYSHRLVNFGFPMSIAQFSHNRNRYLDFPRDLTMRYCRYNFWISGKQCYDGENPLIVRIEILLARVYHAFGEIEFVCQRVPLHKRARNQQNLHAE
ncbi:hypothetical protein BJ912DRAFT_927109 [Pholiota molesta]|nr:hypothetical protein BJ912DRAFT_927109 [Pholiota molesta]